jgi:hypothetical protein
MQRLAMERKRLLKLEPNFYRHLRCITLSSHQMNDGNSESNL